jgi:hypothetical protein
MGANLRPDSTVNSWAVKNVIQERELIETKIKEKDTNRNWKLKNNFSDFG